MKRQKARKRSIEIPNNEMSLDFLAQQEPAQFRKTFASKTRQSPNKEVWCSNTHG